MTQPRAPLSKSDEQELGRNMVDAIRAMMGLGPLYASDNTGPRHRSYDVWSSGNMGAGCRHVRSIRV